MSNVCVTLTLIVCVCVCARVQELSPTTDSNLVKALMSMIDCLMDEFHDEGKVAQLEEREIITWLEVSWTLTCIVRPPKVIRHSWS